MLESDNQKRISQLLEKLSCQIELPEEWGDYFSVTGPLQPIHDDRRRYIRHHFRARAILKIHPTLPMIHRDPNFEVVYMRDLSRQGLGFLHSAQLFPSERCTLWLPERTLSADVVRCRRLNSRCYIVGAKLAVPE